MKTRIVKWSVFALVAAAATFAGSSQAQAERPHFEISFGRRLVRPTSVVHPAVMPGGVAIGLPHHHHHHYVSPVVVAPRVVYNPLVRVGHPAYPYMVGYPTVRRSVVVQRTFIGPTYLGGYYGGTVMTAPRFVARVGF